jgi:hypothetical protein
MTAAHQVAKLIQYRAGDYSIALKFALRYVYKYIAESRTKNCCLCDGTFLYSAKKYFIPEYLNDIPTWAILDSFFRDTALDIIYHADISVDKESDMAYRFRYDLKKDADHDHDVVYYAWTAKSILKK